MSVGPKIFNYSLYAGATWSWLVSLTQADGVTPQDLTGWVVSGELYTPSGGQVPQDLTVAGGQVLLQSVQGGSFVVMVPSSMTQALQGLCGVTVNALSPAGVPSTVGIINVFSQLP